MFFSEPRLVIYQIKCLVLNITMGHYSFERDLLNQSNATFTSKTLFSFLRDLSPLAYSCLLTKLKIKYSIRHVFISSRLGSHFLKIHGFKAKFKVHAALRGSLARSEADGTPHDYCIAPPYSCHSQCSETRRLV